jgi:putative transposase
MHQFDNGATFCGGHTHPGVMGRVVRLCLFLGIEPIFTPVYEARRNHQIETFHSVWNKAFWSRQEFRDCAHVQSEIPVFAHWYYTVYRPPSLEGKTPAQMRQGGMLKRLTADLRRLIPDGRLPITAGRIHVMRKVNQAGQIAVLNEVWPVGQKWVGEYVRATIDTDQQTLTIWHQAETEANWHLIKTRIFRFKETIHAVLPQFRRNRARCRDYWPN